MRFKDYKKEQVASALVEKFDRIHTYPLLRWRALGRSLLFSTVVLAIYLFELCRALLTGLDFETTTAFATAFLFNFFTDYLALFVIRPVLIRSGTKPVIGLVLGGTTGAAIVFATQLVRLIVVNALFDLGVHANISFKLLSKLLAYAAHVTLTQRFGEIFVYPALAVFAWLPVLALGILIARLLTPLSWVVGRTQWFLKEGKEHALRAIGYLAAVVIFIGAVAWRTVFSG
jgi:hypothetical protein